MIRNWITIGAGLLSFLLGATVAGNARAPQDQAAAPAQKAPAYTLAEYNMYQAAVADTNPQSKIMKLDAFVAMYPMSTLLPYAYIQYFQAYLALKNYGQCIVYADKEAAVPNIDTQGRLTAFFTRAQCYYAGSSADKSLQTPDAATMARDAAKQGLMTLDMMAKPASVTDDQFAQQKKGVAVVFNTIMGMASTTLKDYPGCVSAYKSVLMLDPNNAITHFQLGVCDMQLMPPDANGGFWEMARSIGLKSPQGPNEGQVRMYILNQLARYQQASCDNLMTDEVNNLIMLASTSADKPADLDIPSMMDLDKARNDTANFLAALQIGGNGGKVMWLATCGLEYPDILVKVMDAPMVNGDMITMKVYRPTDPGAAADPDAAQKEFDAATDPSMANMTINIMGQPDASRVEKDSLVRFTGTVSGYMQNPFMLTWDKAMINMEDIPAPGGAKKPGAGGRGGRGGAAKKPAAQ